MTLPAPAVAYLRALAKQGMTTTIRLYTPVETQGPGGRPVITWTPGLALKGKFIPARQGGQNIRADQPTPAGDLVMVLPEGTELTEGQRATGEDENRLSQPWRRAVLIKKVLGPRPNEVTRRAMVTEIDGWWPNE